MSKSEQELQAALRRIRRIKAQISRFEFVCSGTVYTRTKVCGKPGCRCATDPEARHGPYHEWSRREEDRLVHTIVSTLEADLIEKALRNYREVLHLLKDWQDQSVRAIRARGRLTPQRKKPRN